MHFYIFEHFHVCMYIVLYIFIHISIYLLFSNIFFCFVYLLTFLLEFCFMVIYIHIYTYIYIYIYIFICCRMMICRMPLQKCRRMQWLQLQKYLELCGAQKFAHHGGTKSEAPEHFLNFGAGRYLETLTFTSVSDLLKNSITTSS